jgi:hypothetical protein
MRSADPCRHRLLLLPSALARSVVIDKNNNDQVLLHREQQALLEARQHVLWAFEELARRLADQTDTFEYRGVHYKKSPAFCNKPGCRQCQAGTGHGPYWFAYRTVEGHPVRNYIGRDLTQIAWEGGRPAFPGSRKADTVESGSQEAKQKVVYRCQISFCTKPSCHKCREGTGHGPYWYAYTKRDGRTVRTYVGKNLPQQD